MAAGTLVRPGYFMFDTDDATSYALNQRNGLVVEAYGTTGVQLRFCASPSCASSSADVYSGYITGNGVCYQFYMRHPNGIHPVRRLNL